MSTLGTMVYWTTMVVFYQNFDQYKDSASDWVVCKLEESFTQYQYGDPSISLGCNHSGAPPPILYLLLPFTALVVTLAGLILSCTDDNFTFWKEWFQEKGAVTVTRMKSFRSNESTKNLSENDSMQEKNRDLIENNREIEIIDTNVADNLSAGKIAIPERSPVADANDTPKSPSTMDGDAFDKAAQISEEKSKKVSVLSATTTATTSGDLVSNGSNSSLPARSQPEMVPNQSDYLSSEDDVASS